MKKGTVLEDVLIEKLIFGGKGLALAPDGKKIIISGGAIPGSRVNLRILRDRKNHCEGQLLDQVVRSPLEEDLPEHFQVYGGCKWLPIRYGNQLLIKEEQVRESFNHIRPFIENAVFHPIIASPEIHGYRNKLEFSWGKYISAREEVHDEYRFGFHKQGEFDRIIDCSYCVLADEEVNRIFKEIDGFARASGFPTYDPKTQQGYWRHLIVRKSCRKQEIMLVFSVNHSYREGNTQDIEHRIIGFVQALAEKYPNLHSAFILHNDGKADIVQGEYIHIYGNRTIHETLLGFDFEINPKSFFQTNSLGAEKLYGEVIRQFTAGDEGSKSPEEPSGKRPQVRKLALDLYAGTGTIGLILSKYFEKVYSIEVVKEASEDARSNAVLNGVPNMVCINAKVEDFLKEFAEKGEKADLLVIDPPRDGMHPDALPNIIRFGAKDLIYVSCNPSTLTRDLEYIVKHSDYRITDVTPVDMFPHTHHIETVVKLRMAG